MQNVRNFLLVKDKTLSDTRMLEYYSIVLILDRTYFILCIRGRFGLASLK